MMHLEVRKKIVEARAKGLKIAEISKAYGVSESAVNRLLRLYRDTGSIMPRTHLRGRKPTLNEEGLDTMRQLIEAQPDITLAEIQQAMQLPIGITAISEIVRNKLGYRFKKNHARCREG